jgi:hypothetical protein
MCRLPVSSDLRLKRLLKEELRSRCQLDHNTQTPWVRSTAEFCATLRMPLGREVLIHFEGCADVSFAVQDSNHVDGVFL